MGIYLPNIEMPQEGQMLVIFPDGTGYVCFNAMRERLAQTKAIPVPPHGRLIDADVLIKTIEADAIWEDSAIDKYTDGIRAGATVTKRLIRDAPAIIEAEEGSE